MNKAIKKAPAKKEEAETTAAKPAKRARKPGKFTFQSVKGMHDILPVDQVFWDKIRKEVLNISDYYGFERIDTPAIENAAVFEKGVGAATDIVEKEMFYIKSDDKLVLRPECTASVVRAYLEHGMTHLPQPVKLYYFGPMYRHEQPQEGRFREFHQVGFEILGSESDPIYDAQVILACYRLLEACKLSKLEIHVNTIGCRVCRPVFRRRLLEYYKNKPICKDCRRRIVTNPLRLLDCKEEKCEKFKKDAPTILDSTCNNCNTHFKSVVEYLDELKIPYILDNNLVRGLDYYSRTTFEIFETGSKLALAGGGRYDYLVEILGGKVTPAVGAALGVERIVSLMQERNPEMGRKSKVDVFLVHIGSLAKKKSLVLIEELRKGGIRVREALGKDSMKSQLRQADKENVTLALIYGQKEAFEDTIIIRDLANSSQETVPLEKLVAEVKRRLK